MGRILYNIEVVKGHNNMFFLAASLLVSPVIGDPDFLIVKLKIPGDEDYSYNEDNFGNEVVHYKSAPVRNDTLSDATVQAALKVFNGDAGDDYSIMTNRKKDGRIHAPSGNNLIITLPVLRREFEISFTYEVQPRWTKEVSVVYITAKDFPGRLFDWKQSDWWSSKGGRTCSMRYEKVSSFDCASKSAGIKTHSANNVVLKQMASGNKYVFQIKYNGNIIFSKINNNAKYHRDVEFYWGGANGWMRDLKMSSFAGRRKELICPQVWVSNTDSNCNGRYKAQYRWLGGRRVYKHVSNERYIFFDNGWSIHKTPSQHGESYHESDSYDIEPWTGVWKGKVTVQCT